MMAALRGVRVLEFAGLAPAPMAGMILADFGAAVTRIDQINKHSSMDRLGRGKRSIALDLRSSQGVKIMKRLCSKADVLIEPFRPGVMERLGLGPSILMEENPKLIYARLTGYGQKGRMSKQAGHDINYIAMTGLLSMIGRKDNNLVPPLNLLGDFSGGSLVCALGILLALFERSQSGRGQVIDSAMIDGAAYLGSFVFKGREIGLWNNERGGNLLDTGAPFYNTYKTLDGKYVSVGALEPKFYKELIQGLQLSEGDLPSQMDMPEWDQQKELFQKIFQTKTRDEWCKIFEGTDACFAPVLTMDEAPLDPHNIEQNTFIQGESDYEPAPAPKLSRTPGRVSSVSQPRLGQNTVEVLLEAGFSKQEISGWLKSGIVASDAKSSL